jgi:carboxyl-terminal processing protease
VFRPLLIGVTAVALLSVSTRAIPQSVPTTSRDAERYINHVLDIMQQNALHRHEVDWPTVRSEALLRVAGAQTTTDTYPAIFYALTQLKERHSFLRLPEDLPTEARRKATASMGAILEPYKQQAPRNLTRNFTNRSEPAGHMIKVGQKSLAYVVIPKCVSSAGGLQEAVQRDQQYADKLHAIAADLDRQNPSGWIIDLRGNLGGDMYPMIAGIGFVLGEGRLGDFISPDSQSGWFYRKGVAGVVKDARESPQSHVGGSPLALKDLPPVAVIADGGTVSAGEAVAISFVGRPKTRLFGAHTFGLSTGNKDHPLSDGATLILCEMIEADRDHHVYPDGIEPDVVFPEPPLAPTEENDLVLQAAEQWLLHRAG